MFWSEFWESSNWGGSIKKTTLYQGEFVLINETRGVFIGEGEFVLKKINQEELDLRIFLRVILNNQ